jgi:hypothetical protein
MTGSVFSYVRQEKEVSVVAAITSQPLAFDLDVLPGSSIHVATSCNAANTNTVKDSANGSYDVPIDSVLDPGNELVRHFKFDNSVGGPITVTSTITAGNDFAGICIREIVNTSGYGGIHSGNFQSFPVSTAADAITSGAATPGKQPGLLSALSTDIAGGSTPLPGTGFTPGEAGWDFGFGTKSSQTESTRYTSLASLAATFTSTNASDDFITVAAFFNELFMMPGASKRRGRQGGLSMGMDLREWF